MKTGFSAKKRAGHGRDEQRKRAKEHEKHHGSHKRRRKHRKHKHHPTPSRTARSASRCPSLPPHRPRPPPRQSPRSAHRRSRSPRRGGCCGARASGRRPGRPRRSSASPWNRSSSASRAPPARRRSPGPEPVNEEGKTLEPEDVWGDDHCWWLDRMLRSDQQLVERMTFIFHDWFANSNEKVNSQRMMLEQNELFRSMCFGSFHDLFLAVTTNPAMLVFLDGIYNEKGNTNENYGARDDGAVLARRRPRRLHPGRRARDGARPDRLARRNGPKAQACRTSTTTPPTTTTASRRSSGRAATGTTKTPSACASNTRCTPRSS